jgi:AraC-like DNA-binding protein
MPLSQWIITARLEGARRELARPGSRPGTVAATAHRWGFADSTHFSRRFRAAYGTSPRNWIRLQAST